MGNPFSPEPAAPREHRNLLDRAHLMGDAGRTGRRVAGEDEVEEFRSLLEGKAQDGKERAPEEKEAEELAALAREERPAPVAAEPSLSAEELEARTEERGRDEAEKRMGAWRGPSPLAGLSAAVTLGLVAAGNVERGERPRQHAGATMRTEIKPGEARVDAEIVEALVQAGLVRPLSGLDDPRLSGTPPLLAGEEGWRNAPVARGVAWSWEAPRRVAWQRVEWSEGHTLLESFAGQKLQVLERQGAQVFVRHEVREAPPKFPV